MAVVFGGLLPVTGWWIWRTVGWWRAGLLPKDPAHRRWTVAPLWSDLVPASTKDRDQTRRAVCAETAFGVLIVVGSFAVFALDGRVDLVVVVSAICAAFALVSLLWVTLIAWGRPRWLLPAEYRHPERYVQSLSVVNK